MRLRSGGAPCQTKGLRRHLSKVSNFRAEVASSKILDFCTSRGSHYRLPKDPQSAKFARPPHPWLRFMDFLSCLATAGGQRLFRRPSVEGGTVQKPMELLLLENLYENDTRITTSDFDDFDRVRDYLLEHGTVLQGHSSNTTEGVYTAYSLDGKIYLHCVVERGEGIIPTPELAGEDHHTFHSAETFSPTTVSSTGLNRTKGIVTVIAVFVLSLLWKATKVILSEGGKYLLSATGMRR